MSKETKYLLHGGYTIEDNKYNREFVKELTSDLGKDDKILLTFFANPRSKWEGGLKFFSELFDKYSGRKLNYILADDDNFFEQAKESKAIYLHGGDALRFLQVIATIPDFREALKGKIVGGSSAGAYVLSKYFCSNIKDKVFKGTGILPIKIRCHYKGEHEFVEKRFVDTHPESSKYDLVLIEDYRYKVFTDN